MSLAVRRRLLYATCIAAVLVLSLGLRLPGLGLKPLHSDEGVNGWFTLRLYWWNVYRYQPSDYHGPFLYYANLLFFWLLGPTDRALRMGTALAGGLWVLALIPARRWLGAVGTLVAGLLVAASPTMVYFSRTAIHEVWLILFTTLWVASLARFAADPSRRWGLVAACSAALCFANKETSVLTTVCLALAAASAWAFGRPASDPRDPDLFGGRTRREALRAWTRGQGATWALGLLAFALVIVVLFSSVFSYARGVPRFFQAFMPWLDYGASGRNQGKPFDYFFHLMQISEGWALAAALLPASWAIVRRHRLGIALVTWSLLAFLVYSVIPYKTPWCVLNLDLPLFLLCGWGARQGWLWVSDAGARRSLRRLAALAIVLPLTALPALVRESWAVDWDGYDDPAHPYVYVQTQRGLYDMLSDHLGVGAAAVDDGRGPRVVNIQAKNPARWYLITRGWDHERSTYCKKAAEESDLEEADIIVAAGSAERSTRELIEGSGGAWHRERYPFRPGWKVSAWYRQPLWDAYQASGGRARWAWPVPESEHVHRPPKPRRYR